MLIFFDCLPIQLVCMNQGQFDALELFSLTLFFVFVYSSDRHTQLEELMFLACLKKWHHEAVCVVLKVLWSFGVLVHVIELVTSIKAK